MSDRNISLSQIVSELHDEGYEVLSERQYRRYFERFFNLSGSSIERFRVGKPILFTKNEAIVYKEIIRLVDMKGFVYKFLAEKEDEITDYDIVTFYETMENVLKGKVEFQELDKEVAETFLKVIDISIGYNFTKLVFELQEKFRALLKITNIYPYEQQLDVIQGMLDKFNPFFNRVYTTAMKDIIKLTEDKIKRRSDGKVEEYLDKDGNYTLQTVRLVEVDKRVSEFFKTFPDERKKLEKIMGIEDISKHYITDK